MLPSRSGILAEAINTMEMQWVAYDHAVCGSSDAMVIGGSLYRNTSRWKTSARLQPALNKTLLSATRYHQPSTIKALHTRKIIKLGFLSLPYWFLTEISRYQSWKAKLFPAFSGNDLGSSEIKANILPIMPLKHSNDGISKRYIPNIKFLQCNPNDVSLPWIKAT